MVQTIGYFGHKTVPQGASTTVYLTVNDSVQGGEYYEDCCIATASKIAQSEELQDELWTFSERETGVKFPVTFDNIKK
jgi:hypothetical protein